MSEPCKVSVIMATYRREIELKRVLLSLAAQTFKGMEIVLVDDNDHPEWNERVGKVAKDFRAQFPAIALNYIQNHPSLGSALTRNVGIDAAQGTHITFLDDDDVYFPEKVATQYSHMIENGLDYSVTDLDLYYDNETLSEHRNRSYIQKNDRESLLRYHVMHHIACPNTMMFTKAYLEKIGAFPPIDLGDDFYLMERAILGDGRFGYLNRCDVKAYVHLGEVGLSSGSTKIHGQNTIYEYKKKYFYLLDKKSLRFTKMRHHAVLAFAYLRMKKRGSFCREACRSFLASPIACAKLLIKRLSKT